jgi:hypothetical protein
MHHKPTKLCPSDIRTTVRSTAVWFLHPDVLHLAITEPVAEIGEAEHNQAIQV